jgi:hypothetical protein
MSQGFRGVSSITCSNGEIGRDQQHRDRGKVAGIDAVRRGERKQHLALREWLHDHQPDSHGRQHERHGPAPAVALHAICHLPDRPDLRVVIHCSPDAGLLIGWRTPRPGVEICPGMWPYRYSDSSGCLANSGDQFTASVTTGTLAGAGVRSITRAFPIRGDMAQFVRISVITFAW